jgi:DNA repair protein RadC
MCAEDLAEKQPKARSRGHREESFFDGDAWVGCRTYVKLVRENSCRRPYRISAPSDVYGAFAGLRECDRERFYSVHVDVRNQVCGVELVSQGTLTSSLVTPREVYKAVILGNATGLIAVHNHPSGNPAPSADDRAITRQLAEAGRILDIPLYDHVILGEQAYFSFAEAGLL